MKLNDLLESTPKRAKVVMYQECPVEPCTVDLEVERWQGSGESAAESFSKAADKTTEQLAEHISTEHGTELE